MGVPGKIPRVKEAGFLRDDPRLTSNCETIHDKLTSTNDPTPL